MNYINILFKKYFIVKRVILKSVKDLWSIEYMKSIQGDYGARFSHNCSFGITSHPSNCVCSFAYICV